MLFFRKKFLQNIIFVSISILALMIIVLSQPTETFPKEVFNIHIQKGDGVSYTSKNLFDKGVIKSQFLFKIITVIISGNKGVHAGDYRFTEPQNTFRIAYRMVNGHQDQPKVSITIPEGTNVSDTAFIFLKKLSDFNAPRFVSLAKKYEGYLYPDTYYFLANVKSEEIIDVMRENFDEKIKEVNGEIKNFEKSVEDIVIMASIVEKEANNSEDRRVVAGILWKRLKENMHLQVDPPFYYITGKTSGVTFDDLKVDSPYNTYKYKGLPKGPISNPGIKAIKDTINPISTKYYFYLTGKDGVMRYANTYAGHLENIRRYLK